MTFNPFKLRKQLAETQRQLDMANSRLAYECERADKFRKQAIDNAKEIERMKIAAANVAQHNIELQNKIQKLEKKQKGFWGKGKRK